MDRLKGLWRNRFTRLLFIPTIIMMLSMAALPANSFAAPATPASGGGCTLGTHGNIHHVIYLQFDNVHFTRDNPNVPSDLEQMPNLLNFLEGNGTLLTNHHTPLIAHTADDILTSLTGVYGDQHGVPIKVHADSAPVYFITGNPVRTSTTTRTLERAVGKLTAKNVITGNTDTLTKYLADPVELQLLHMITADPARTPSFVQFALPDYYLLTGAPNCKSPCTFLDSGFAWNHGDVSPDVNVTWLGMVGPGVLHQGVQDDIWSDHTDIRPTMLALLGLKDDYAHEGRVLIEVLADSALPDSLRESRDIFVKLASVLKQIDAPVGDLGLTTLSVSTRALESNSANDSTYTRLEDRLASVIQTRNAIANKMLDLLEDAAFHNKPISADQAEHLIDQGNALLQLVHGL